MTHGLAIKCGISFVSLILAISLSSVFAEVTEQAQVPRFVGSDLCSSCHTSEARAWRQSHHASAWNSPTNATVLGDFNQQQLELDGSLLTFSSQNGQFFIESESPDGIAESYEVIGTAGITPLQQYLIETEPGKVQAHDAVWDTVAGRWYDLYAEQAVASGDRLDWHGPYKNWNARCAECHATGFVKNYDESARSYASEQAETGVGCEACHGPGEAHVSWADSKKDFEFSAWTGIKQHGFTINFEPDHASVEFEQCAACHSRREPFASASPIPGSPFADHYRLALLREGLYFPDGQILDEVYVYGSFLQSKMYSSGVRCTDCHDAHSSELVFNGNAVCTQCHNPVGRDDFPGLKPANYDSEAHTHHERGSEGSECKNCHMSERIFMGIDGRRDHSFRIPRPDLSVDLGIPNACTDCHTRETAEWAAKKLVEWFPQSALRGPHFATSFASARAGNYSQRTLDELVGLAMSDRQVPIVRATALALLERTLSPQVANRTSSLLRHPDPLIRAAAIALQGAAEPSTRIRRIVPLFDDIAASVRIAAVRASLDLLEIPLPADDERAMLRAMSEFQASLVAKTDYPEGQLVIGGTSLVLRNFQAAEAAFLEAVRLDPHLVEAWQMVSRIRAATNDIDGARQALREGLAANPGNQWLLQTIAELGS